MFSASNSPSHSTRLAAELLVTGTSRSARPISFWLLSSTPRSMARMVQPAGVRHISRRLAPPVSTSCVRPMMNTGAVAILALLVPPSVATLSLNTPEASMM